MRWRRWLGSAGPQRRSRPPSAAAASFQPIRRERLIAGCRVALSVASLVALWLDPSEPARFARLAYGLVAAYALAWRAASSPSTGST